MRFLGRKTQQISAVQVIGEVVHADFEFLPCGEKFVFTSGHMSHGFRHVLAHELCGAVGQVEEIGALMHLIFVIPTRRVEDI